MMAKGGKTSGLVTITSDAYFGGDGIKDVKEHISNIEKKFKIQIKPTGQINNDATQEYDITGKKKDILKFLADDSFDEDEFGMGFSNDEIEEFYPELFEKNGFSIIGEWDTYELRLKDAIKDFFSKRKSLSKKKEGGHSFSKDPKLKTTIRSIEMKNWDQELQIIYNLFVSAYTNMPEFETISFDQFKLIYDDFKYIVQPWLSYIVELQGKPVGFSINFVDPLPILTKYKDKKLNNLQKAWVFARLRMNRSTLMIAHVGKIPGPNGEDIKGVQIQVSKRIAFFSLMMKKVIVTFQNADSPSRRTWNEDVQKPYARYLLYGISL
jgi:hypothetical protein